jgi:ATP-dependent Zn protease
MEKSAMSRKPTKQLISTAYHEAGHVVAAHFQDIRFRHATIKPDEADNSLGHVLYGQLSKAIVGVLNAGELTPRQRAHIEARIIASFAGGIAERKYRGRHNNIGRRQDLRNAFDFADALSSSEREAQAYQHLLYIRAEDLIEKYWWVVEALADALMVAETLTADEARQAIYRASDRRLEERKQSNEK